MKSKFQRYPAKGKQSQCYNCQGIGHFAKCCKSKKKQGQTSRGAKILQISLQMIVMMMMMMIDDDDDDEFAFVASGGITPQLELNIGGVPRIQFIIDSGASCNIIDRQLWEELKKNKVKRISRKCKKKLFLLMTVLNP